VREGDRRARKKRGLKIDCYKLGVMAQVYNPCTWKAEARRLQVLAQPGLLVGSPSHRQIKLSIYLSINQSIYLDIKKFLKL
jgi:hypothetical protein